MGNRLPAVLLHAGELADKIVVGLAGVPIMDELQLTPKQFGFLGSAFFFLFSVSAIVFGFIAGVLAPAVMGSMIEDASRPREGFMAGFENSGC